MYRHFFKRACDILVAVIGLPLFILLFLVISPLIFLEDKGSIFYVSDRLGLHGKVFKMYKFRTMRMNSADIRNTDGSTYNSDHDHRVTRVGKFLRKTSIDEVPQVINVLLGNMSIIGPRPDLPEHLNVYNEIEKRKLDVRPGITGYNQAYYRNSISWKDRLVNDVIYVDKYNFILDIKIFFRTIKMILSTKHVYMNSGETNEDK